MDRREIMTKAAAWMQARRWKEKLATFPSAKKVFAYEITKIGAAGGYRYLKV